MSIQQIKIRATIVIGSLSVSTPFISSFDVNKQRGGFSTFSASIKVKSSQLSVITGQVVIYAGGGGALNKIFTGFIKQVKPSPCWDDPSYTLINISGSDVLSKLEGRKFTRRQTFSDNCWTVINSAEPGIRSGKAKFTNVPTIVTTGGFFDTSGGTANNPSSPIPNNSESGSSTKTGKDSSIIFKLQFQS